MTPELDAILANLPTQSGVYLMKDAAGTVLYVGKAQNLRSRVRSYWQKQGGPSAGQHLIRSAIDRVADVEYTITDSVSEALLLEANLIKRFRPRFNVRLKDDKSYPFLKITLADDFPRIERTRKLANDGSRYFGPYASASSVDESMVTPPYMSSKSAPPALLPLAVLPVIVPSNLTVDVPVTGSPPPPVPLVVLVFDPRTEACVPETGTCVPKPGVG